MKFPLSVKNFKIRFSIQDLACLFLLTLLLAQQLPQAANDPGIGWNLKGGQFILETGEIPQSDLFLHSSISKPWIFLSWLSNVIFAIVFQIGSWTALSIFVTIIFLYTWTYLIYKNARRTLPFVSPIAITLAILLTSKLAMIHFVIRAVLLSFIPFALLFSKLQSWKNDISLSKEVPYFTLSFYSFGIFAIWVNLHPSFVLGFILVAVFAFSLLVESLLLRSGLSFGKAFLTSLTISFASVLGSLVNPYGLSIHKLILWHPNFLSQGLNSNETKDSLFIHQEWLPISFAQTEGEIFLTVIILLLLGILIGGIRKFGFFSILCIVLFAIGTVLRVRILPYFAIVTVAPLAMSIYLIAKRIASREKAPWPFLSRQLGKLNDREREFLHPGPMLAVLSAMLVGFTTLTSKIPFNSPPYKPSSAIYPYQALRFLLTKQNEKTVLVVAAPSNWGGFLTFFGEDRIKPLIDDRNEFAGKEFYQKFHNAILKFSPDWKSYLINLGAEYALLPQQSSIVNALKQGSKDPTVKIIYEDELAVLVKF